MVRFDRHAFRMAHLAVLSVALAAAACGNSATEPGLSGLTRTFMSDSVAGASGHVIFGRPHAEADPPTVRNGLLYSAAVVPIDSAAGSGPMDLRIDVRVANPTASTVTLPVKGCTVWPEFRLEKNAAEPIWVPEMQCAQDSHAVTIEPGRDHVFSFLAYDVMLSHALEDGRYYVTARFHHAEETLRLNAGSADVRLGVPNLAFHVRLQEDAGRIAASVRLENRNPHAVSLEWGHCALGFELYADDAELTRTPLQLESERGCLRYLATGVVQSGAELSPKEFSYTADAGAGRNPAVGPGKYYIVATLQLNWRTYRFPMGEITLR